MRRAKGFTLLEVMVALAILGVGLAIVIQAMGLSLRAGRRSRELSVATLLLEDRLSEIRREGFPDEGSSEGVFPPPYDNLRWTAEVKAEELPELEEFDNVLEEGKRTQVSSVYAHIAPELAGGGEDDEQEQRLRERVLRRVIVSIRASDDEGAGEPLISAETFVAIRVPPPAEDEEDSGVKDRRERLRQEREERSRETLGERASATGR